MQITLNNEHQIASTLTIRDGYVVFKNGEEIEKEIVRYQVSIQIDGTTTQTRNVEWHFKEIEQDYFGVDEDDIDLLDTKIFLGVRANYTIDSIGRYIGSDNPKEIFRKIDVNTFDAIVDEPIGTQPGDENIAKGIMYELFKPIYFDELFEFIKKFHKKYGIELPENEQIEQRGTFKRRMGGEYIPAIERINSNFQEEGQIFTHTLRKKMDFENTLKIFEKDKEAFKPLNKAVLQEWVKTKKFDCEYEENIRYNIQLGLIESYEKKSISIMNGLRREEVFSIGFE